jgi:3-methylfumaryl-CoA hydratase
LPSVTRSTSAHGRSSRNGRTSSTGTPSALTYNAHRIHYDRTYVQQVEGYPGLVVHGPLQAMLMTAAARSRRPQPRLVEFSSRLVAPVFDHEAVVVTARAAENGRGTSRRPSTAVAVC